MEKARKAYFKIKKYLSLNLWQYHQYNF
jgi:hypothetical protein